MQIQQRDAKLTKREIGITLQQQSGSARLIEIVIGFVHRSGWQRLGAAFLAFPDIVVGHHSVSSGSVGLSFSDSTFGSLGGSRFGIGTDGRSRRSSLEGVSCSVGC